MPDQLVMNVFSRGALDEESARTQLELLISFDKGRFQPKRWLDKVFGLAHLEAPSRHLAEAGAELEFKRNHARGRIKNLRFGRVFSRDPSDQRWRALPEPREPIFKAQWTVWFDLPAILRQGLAMPKRFLLAVFAAARADYAFLTPYSDFKTKNHQVVADGHGTTEQFVGESPERGIPGLYWLNVFGPAYTAWFGDRLTALPALPQTELERQPDGTLLIQFGPTPEAAETAAVQQSQRAAITALGDDAFFDLERPGRVLDVSMLATPRDPAAR